ncbi:alpha/beta fold hydrolase [Deinococcus sp. Leaf326]|uniref:alpha/beta fold hydrolase n=1 Tax=Deinococcus sp. Leaf326 TaxID=1736338 RepID=UPI0009E87CAA|nr:alpha/beta hydrolase [Deinococcus sp. Leaf326]
MSFPQSASTQPPKTQYLQRPDGQLAYDDQGQGPLIVAVPGLGDLRQTYRLLTPQLVAADYRVVTLDPRGQGESSAQWPTYSPMSLGDDLSALIEHLGSGPAVVVSNSYSGGAAIWTAVQTPALVASIVLISPFVRDPKTSAMQRLMLSAMTHGPWKVGAWMAYLGTLFKGGKPNDDAAYRARLSANLREPGRYAALQAMLGETRAPIEARLGEVQAPSLVLLGRADPDFTDPAAEAHFIATALHGEEVLLEGTGHYPQAERPDETARTILQFLAKHPEV